MTNILWAIFFGFFFGFCAGFIARGDNHAGAIRALAEMSFNEQIAAYKLNIAKLKSLLYECRQKMFEAEKNYGFDDAICDILDPQMKKIDEVQND